MGFDFEEILDAEGDELNDAYEERVGSAMEQEEVNVEEDDY